VEDKTCCCFVADFSVKRCLLRTCTSALVLFVGITIPQFGVILSLFGGTTITATNFVFPPLFYILLSRQKQPSDGYGPLPDPDSITAVEDVYAVAHNQSEDSVEEPFGQKRSMVRRKTAWKQIDIPCHITVLLCEIMFVGIVGGIASTYSVVLSLVDGSSGFSVPCYVNWTAANV